MIEGNDKKRDQHLRTIRGGMVVGGWSGKKKKQIGPSPIQGDQATQLEHKTLLDVWDLVEKKNDQTRIVPKQLFKYPLAAFSKRDILKVECRGVAAISYKNFFS